VAKKIMPLVSEDSALKLQSFVSPQLGAGLQALIAVYLDEEMALLLCILH
jgi:hypothetical protein